MNDTNTTKTQLDLELARLEKRIEELLASIDTLKEENRALRQRHESLNNDRAGLLQKNDPREAKVVKEPVFSTKQAKDRAFSILSDCQKKMVQASVTTVGLPDLRAGRQVLIKGVGARFSGLYFVTDTTHTIGSNGYLTKFNARREDDGSATRQ